MYLKQTLNEVALAIRVFYWSTDGHDGFNERFSIRTPPKTEEAACSNIQNAYLTSSLV
jgi:hypothetical protein